MASPQKENGYTPIANELLEAFLKYKFPKNTGDAPFCLWLFIARKTYGYSKKEDAISLTQFEKGVNSPRNTIVHWLEYMVKANLLVKANELGKNGYIYAINKDYDTWIPLVKAKQLVKARKLSSSMALTKSSSMALTHINKKQYIHKQVLQSKDCEEFSYNNQLKKMFDDKDIRMWIIASYWTFKGIKSSNWEQYRSQLKRELRASTDLKGYDKKRIYEVMDWLSKNADFKWTLETVLKYIDEELTKLELGGLSEDERAKREAERIRKMYDK